MPNPYEKLLEPKVEWEDVEASELACQTCNEIVTTGRYADSLTLLTWKCTNGHVSKIVVQL